jgi:predicted Fe-Mo cluster-binding NifX family protein
VGGPLIAFSPFEQQPRPGGNVRIAIPRMGEHVAPCLEYCATMAIFTIAAGEVVEQIDFPLRSRDPFDRVRLLRDQCVHTIICGGIQEVYEDVLRASGMQVISWVSGTVDDLVELYLRGKLVTETDTTHAGRPGEPKQRGG